MAPWQVVFSIVPRGTLDVAAIDYARHLNQIAAPSASADADLQTWGPEDGNRVEVASVNGHVTSMTARVDVRRLDSRFGAMLLHFVRIANAVLVRSDGLVVEPLVGAFAASLRNSDAWRFANDPLANARPFADFDDDSED